MRIWLDYPDVVSVRWMALMWVEDGKKWVCYRWRWGQEAIRKLSNSSFLRSCYFLSKCGIRGKSKAKKQQFGSGQIWASFSVIQNLGKVLHHSGSHTCFRIYKKEKYGPQYPFPWWWDEQWSTQWIWEKITLWKWKWSIHSGQEEMDFLKRNRK